MTYNSVPAFFHLYGSSQVFSQLSVSHHSNAHKKTLSCNISGILSAVNGKRLGPELLRLLIRNSPQSTEENIRNSLQSTEEKPQYNKMASQTRTGIAHNQYLVAGVHQVVPLNKR